MLCTHVRQLLHIPGNTLGLFPLKLDARGKLESSWATGAEESPGRTHR